MIKQKTTHWKRTKKKKETSPPKGLRNKYRHRDPLVCILRSLKH